MNGFINVLKAPGITSSTVVTLLRYILKMKKIGHAGTLDTAACGVLLVMIWIATKLFDYLDQDGKEYISEFVFGIETDTLDMQGQITNKNSLSITKEDIQGVIKNFVGSIDQFPPKVSAIQIDGRKAYNLQRQGIEFEVPKRNINIKSIELIRKTGPNRFLLKVACSKGTYIRSLCRDIANTLGTFGYINYLIRIKNSYFTIDSAHSIEYLRSIDAKSVIIPIDEPIDYMDKIDIHKKYFNQLINGVKIDISGQHQDIFRVYCNQHFIGLGKQELIDNTYKLRIIKRLYEQEEN